MLRNARKLEAIHRRHDRERFAAMSYDEALSVFTALWQEARALGWRGSDRWLAELEPDFAVARVLNDRFHRP